MDGLFLGVSNFSSFVFFVGRDRGRVMRELFGDGGRRKKREEAGDRGRIREKERNERTKTPEKLEGKELTRLQSTLVPSRLHSPSSRFPEPRCALFAWIPPSGNAAEPE